MQPDHYDRLVEQLNRKHQRMGNGAKSQLSQDSQIPKSEFTSEPEPLRRPLPPAEPYPMQALGNVLGVAAQRIHDVLCVPEAMAGQSILAAASLAVQPHADVEIDGRRELLSLWHMTVGVSGERKSACDQLALRRHREHERAAIASFAHEQAEHALDMIAFDHATKSLKKGDPDSIRDELSRIGPGPAPPLKPLLLVGSPTIEAVHIQIRDGLPSIGLFHDDAGEFLGGYSMSSDHRVKTVASMSKLWDVGEFDRIRGDGGSKYYGKRLALHLMMQPVIAETVLSDEVLTGQGFLARCLLSWPASTIGTRGYVETDLSADPAMRRYWDTVGGFLKRAPTLRADTRNDLEPRCLALTPEAKRRWIDIHNLIETDTAEAGSWASVRPWASKAAAQVLRIAGVLTLVEQSDCGVIGVDHIDRAAVLINHYLTEAVRIVGTNSVEKAVRDAEALLAWCHEARIQYLHSAAALQMGPTCVRSKANFDDAIVKLSGAGWADSVPNGMVIDGKHRRRVWRVRP